MKSSNESGQAYAFMAMTPIVEGQEDDLRDYLEGIPRAASPFAKLPRTHLARWVILDDFHNEKEQPRQERLRCRYLIFTSNFDGPLDPYMDALCALPEASEIWGRTGEDLKAYLLQHRVKTGVFFAAYPDATLDDVTRSLDRRERLIDFAVSSQGMEPAQLQAAFDAEFRT